MTSNIIESCRCECGYSCGGPGYCDLETIDCINKHFKRDCDHKFEGPLVQIDELTKSVICSICNVSSMTHDCIVGP